MTSSYLSNTLYLQDGIAKDPMLCDVGLKIAGYVLNALSTIVLLLLIFTSSINLYVTTGLINRYHILAFLVCVALAH